MAIYKSADGTSYSDTPSPGSTDISSQISSAAAPAISPSSPMPVDRIYKDGNSYSGTPGPRSVDITDAINGLARPQNAAKPLGAAPVPDPILPKECLSRPPGSQIDTHQITARSTDGLFSFPIKVIS